MNGVNGVPVADRPAEWAKLLNALTTARPRDAAEARRAHDAWLATELFDFWHPRRRVPHPDTDAANATDYGDESGWRVSLR